MTSDCHRPDAMTDRNWNHSQSGCRGALWLLIVSGQRESGAGLSARGTRLLDCQWVNGRT